MNLFNKLPGFERSPAGLERRILRALPLAMLGSLLAPLIAGIAILLGPDPASGLSAERQLADLTIAATAFVVTAWTAILTVAIGCAIVILMKGPAYVADPYPLSDADQPQHPARGGKYTDDG